MTLPENPQPLSPRQFFSGGLAVCFVLFFAGVMPFFTNGLHNSVPEWLFLLLAMVPVQLGNIASCLIPLWKYPSDRRWYQRLELKAVDRTDLKPVFLGTLAVYLLAAAVTALMVSLLRRLGISPEEQAIVTMLRRGSPLIAAVLIPGAVLLAPFGEELCFRYAICRMVESYAGFPAAAAVTALFFAGIHGNLQVFPALFLLSLWLSWLYRRTGSLLAPMMAHALFNAMSILLILLNAG